MFVFEEAHPMRQIVFVLLAVVALGGVLAYTAPLSGQSAGEAAPIYGIKIPAGYRDWKLISVAHEEGNFNDLRAQLGNDVAINAYREGKLPFPDGTIIAALHWHYVSSEENNKAFGRAQTEPAFPATSPSRLATLSSPVTHLNTKCHRHRPAPQTVRRDVRRRRARNSRQCR
jgi:hypothetical protein